MIYLNERDLEQIGIDWPALALLIENAVASFAAGECAQPIKPYLKYGDERNRIIAMPAYVNRPARVAGLKWIASFPGNIEIGIPRANSVTILNDPDTGVPNAIVLGSLISAIRTAAVSGTLLRKLVAGGEKKLRIALIGMGPIGRMHVHMLNGLLGDRISRIVAYDRREVQVEEWLSGVPAVIPVEKAASWQEAYRDADVVFTCTAAPERYIDEAAKPDAILMHVSLRDYELDALANVGAVIVDSWEEICRADTDTERLHLHAGLQEEGTMTLAEALALPADRIIQSNGPTLFTPMGLAVFDVAVAAHYAEAADRLGVGQRLE
ncbi:2,3-diaminopropionate biosynthesis protein SbnB [Paenibacillus glycanilyticus]|uniref:N-[(2S)-2-amino-2-carboxyethyl]-L-glutamate dehydrogenase SbnB n=1 Tax=Paenibacillus glycanilyticus TaxID=126569 RepID=A0ABQ6G5H1_9BACL|nr:2,3-diaminopropionate biosynthesis protein SbnB [Paenibacillus glycanilyticus]GLX66211.1 N-[(2S)-2-amino-2-carboxyethyl]-L-glutamate dehydrogenase SbnB [Paenibacillus glycanilyticus]